MQLCHFLSVHEMRDALADRIIHILVIPETGETMAILLLEVAPLWRRVWLLPASGPFILWRWHSQTASHPTLINRESPDTTLSGCLQLLWLPLSSRARELIVVFSIRDLRISCIKRILSEVVVSH